MRERVTRDLGKGNIVSYGGAAATREILSMTEEVHPVMEGETRSEGGGAGAPARVAGQRCVVH